MMKYLLTAVGSVMLAAFGGSAAIAADLSSDQDYFGHVTSIAPGFYGNFGVQLQSGSTCNGRSIVALHSDNSHYTEIVALLFTAQASNAPIKLHAIGATTDSAGFCVISEAAMGDFSAWGSAS